MTVVIYDLESDGRPLRDDKSEPDFTFVQITCGCALVLDTRKVLDGSVKLEDGKELTVWRDVLPNGVRDPMEPLLELFDSADIIAGYNCLDFDFPLLKRHYGRNGGARYASHRMKCLDAFARIRSITGYWPKLQTLLRNNGIADKSGDGKNAIVLWETGRRDELASYCIVDVRRTAQLMLLPTLKLCNVTLPAYVYGIQPQLCAMGVENRKRYEDGKLAFSTSRPIHFSRHACALNTSTALSVQQGRVS